MKAGPENRRRSRPALKTPVIAPARRLAFRILTHIDAGDAHSDALLRSPEVDALSAPDRHLTTMLVLGTLRWQLALDARIRPLLARPDARLPPEAATALRLGAYQLLHLDRVPAHAVLHDSVELVKRGNDPGAAGMVNAVLRKIQSTSHRPQPAEAHSAAELAAHWAHPSWMVERWVRSWGLQASQVICQWDQEPPPLTVRADPWQTFPGLTTEPGAFLSCARRVVRGDPGGSAPLRAAHIRIQDEASQLVAEILAAAAVPDARTQPASAQPLRVLDLCAAPGGKTAILAERLPASRITAVDVSRQRVLAAQSALRAANPDPTQPSHVRWQVADATRLPLEAEYDAILCDVPCSGTGTLARNPEIRLRLTEDDLPRQADRQRAILRSGLAGLRPGGRLVYSTCSLEPEENEQVIESVLEEMSGARLVPVSEVFNTLLERAILTPEGRERLRTAVAGPYLRTLPGLHPCDGFFAALLERA